MVTNHLIQEKSPYLLQHAHNPVDWYPWSDEAFARAKAENKPIFLSIGYATCHWCHVMERESFEDDEVAGHINETFISIKVDREERPDIDSIYMAACQMLTGSGGWPLTILMTPSKMPFFAGTYFPKHSRFGRLGLIELCQQVSHLWVHEKQKILSSAKSIVDSLGNAFAFKSTQDLDGFVIENAYQQIEKGFDTEFGGFETAPKFPTPHRLLFLLRYYHRTGTPAALEMVRSTLVAMRLGGIWDHIGFGFHRYSTDRKWLVPHFEKMLYDQALLSMAYLEMYQVTKDPFFATTADEIFTYVLRDMTSDEGAFFAAEDADSEGEEGKFYVWSAQSFHQILGKEEAALWGNIFNLKAKGNFSEEATGRKTGVNIPHLDKPLFQWAKDLGMEKDWLIRRWEGVRKKLFDERKDRIHPLKDDKILTDWNGLMIAALALGSRVLNNPEYAKSAQKAAAFIYTKMLDGHNRLWHRYRHGDVAIEASANDYAFFITGMLNLYAATFDPAHLEAAIALQECMFRDFWDNEAGGFFLTTNENKDLPVRPKELYDGAMPSANSVSLLNLLYLFKLTGDLKWEYRASEQSRAFSGTVRDRPWAYSYFLLGVDFANSQGREVVIVGELDGQVTRDMLSVISQNFDPNTVTLVKSDQHAEKLSEVAPFTAAIAPLKGKTAAFVCTGFSCNQPVTDLQLFMRLIGKKEKPPATDS